MPENIEDSAPGPQPRRGGRPAWKPDLSEVERLARLQLTMEQIAAAMGIHVATLYRHKAAFREFCDAIKRGQAAGLKTIADKLYASAATGNITAQIFIMKAKGGWRDMPDPAAVNVNINNGIPGGSHWSPEAIEARRAETKKLLSYFSLEDKIEYLAMLERARVAQVAEREQAQKGTPIEIAQSALPSDPAESVE